MASTPQIIPFSSPAQDRFIELDIPDDRLDLSENEADRTAWQDLLTYEQEVRS